MVYIEDLDSIKIMKINGKNELKLNLKKEKKMLVITEIQKAWFARGWVKHYEGQQAMLLVLQKKQLGEVGVYKI
jgi:hypothetical protein